MSGTDPSVVPLPDSFADATRPLSPRQRRLVVGAINFHALVERGSRVALHVLVRPSNFGLVLTGTNTHRSGTAHLEFEIGRIEFDALPGSDDERRSVDRVVVVNRELGDAADQPIAEKLNPYWRLRTAAEHRFPLGYDALRQRLLERRVRALKTQRIERAPVDPRWSSILPVEPAGKPRAVLIGIHWFEMGGAERWAFETIRLVKEAGLLPIVLSDRFSYHPWITRAEVDGAVVLPLTHPLGEAEEADGGSRLLTSIFSTYNIRGVFVHHNQWLYDRLPIVRCLKPDVPVIDALHILEYSGGGYPASGVIVDDYIDIHHVISPQLTEWLTSVQGVDPKKIVLAPLAGLTSAQGTGRTFSPRHDDSTFTVGFIGRFARQKRPYLFLQLAHVLRRSRRGDRYRFIVHGDGELEDVIERMIRKFRLAPVLEVRGHEVPVSRTLDEIDVLVLSSQNEGITLTTFEALANGVPVVSTDVGSQRTLIPEDLLVPRSPADFTRRAAEAVRNLADDEPSREDAWRREFELAQEFSQYESANSWAEGVFHQWSQ